MADSIRTLFRRSILENLRKSRFQTGIILDCLDPWRHSDPSMDSGVCQMANTDGNRNKEGITFRLKSQSLSQRTMQIFNVHPATVSRLPAERQGARCALARFYVPLRALNQASGKLTIFEHDEIVIVREACDEIPDSLLQIAQTQVDDHAKDTANDGRTYVGRTMEIRARGAICTDWRCRIRVQ